MSLSSISRLVSRKVCPRFSQRRNLILGIETSCDDTGACVMDFNGKVLGESISTQHSQRYGGVIPTFARHFHAKKIENVVQGVLVQAGISPSELSAIAVTNRPGLKGPLMVGTDYAKYLCLKYKLPMIPVHHMEAHALTARMDRPDLNFPFMVLLISGGHCLLAHCEDIHQFILLGESIDDSPGEALDKCARMLGLHNLPGLRDVSGGAAIELIARRSKQRRALGIPMRDYRDCRFSFSGMKAQIYDIHRFARMEPGQMFSQEDLGDLCAGIQYVVTKHLAERLQRGCEYLVREDRGPPPFLVVSGGVASNMFIRQGLEKVASHFDMEAVFPPPRLCTDNGVMIAWAGLERWRRDLGVIQPQDVLQVEVESRCPLGSSIHTAVEAANIKCKWIKI